jgi:hypothetical protein
VKRVSLALLISFAALAAVLAVSGVKTVQPAAPKAAPAACPCGPADCDCSPCDCPRESAEWFPGKLTIRIIRYPFRRHPPKRPIAPRLWPRCP